MRKETVERHLNPSRPDRGRREKINLIFYLRTSLWCLKEFYEGHEGRSGKG